MADPWPHFDSFHGVIGASYPGEHQVALFVLGSCEVVLCSHSEWAALLELSVDNVDGVGVASTSADSSSEHRSDDRLIQLLRTLSVL